MEEEKYGHSDCCNKHWEVVIKDEIHHLVCEDCGKDSGLKLTDPEALLNNTKFKSTNKRTGKEIIFGFDDLINMEFDELNELLHEFNADIVEVNE